MNPGVKAQHNPKFENVKLIDIFSTSPKQPENVKTLYPSKPSLIKLNCGIKILVLLKENLSKASFANAQYLRQ